MMRGLVSTSGLVVLGLVLITCSGCGESLGPSGTVTGTAKLKGQNLKAGTLITFTAERGTIASATVADDGTYVARIIGNPSPEKIPVGTYKIAVNAPSSGGEMSEADYEAMMNSGGKPPEAKKDTSIPAKYNSGQTSGLTIDVVAGENTKSIELE
jgi:hypothetical protein